MVPRSSMLTTVSRVGERAMEVLRRFDTSEDEPLRCMEISLSG
jgi:hypothetical protein